jgi:rhodanese-related sulfurtransferase
MAEPSIVASVPAAASQHAWRHFSDLLAYETDSWDVHACHGARATDFVLLDVRSPESFAAGHIDGARSLPHGRIDAEALSAFDQDTLFVVYCAGPHCNGADRAAVHLAALGRPVKKMIGGVTGWRDEGFALVTGPPAV